MRFAKLFNVQDTQVLTFMKYDSEKDMTMVTLMTHIDEVLIETKFEHEGDQQEEEACKLFDSIDEAKAVEFFQKMDKAVKGN